MSKKQKPDKKAVKAGMNVEQPRETWARRILVSLK